MSASNAEHLRASSPIATHPDVRYVFVTGGVVSGLGKGITISSIGRLLKSMGMSVTCIKIDPYLNSDAGTMSPFEHGETFVLNDGGETDLDLGNYERFLDVELTKDHNITTGKVYSSVIKKERRGDFLGKTVQVVPHITDEVQNWIAKVSQIPVENTTDQEQQQPPRKPKNPDICLVEVGGTVGDIESTVFLESLRQFQFRVGRENCCLVHVSLVPVLGAVGEQKTKPTQHGVKTLMSLGLLPDIIVCRSTSQLEDSTRQKISSFCHVAPENVVSLQDVSNIYHVPLLLEQQGVHHVLAKTLHLDVKAEPNLLSWKGLAENVDKAMEAVSIAIVGKYTKLSDAYLSVIKALKHACIPELLKLELIWIESAHLEPNSMLQDKHEGAWKDLKRANGVLIPGGFGERGIEGKIAAAKYARENKVPILGICLGFQSMVIEFARSILGQKRANSTEFKKDSDYPVIIKMLEHHTGDMGGTMRLGARKTIFHPLPESDNQARSIAEMIHQGKDSVMERHRHRYEVDPEKVEELEKAGLRFTGKDDKGQRMELLELPMSEHPYFFGTQYHPELKSRPNRLSPPFKGLILAAAGRFEGRFRSPNGSPAKKQRV